MRLGERAWLYCKECSCGIFSPPTLIGKCYQCHHDMAGHWVDRQPPAKVNKYRVVDAEGNDVTEELFGRRTP